MCIYIYAYIHIYSCIVLYYLVQYYIKIRSQTHLADCEKHPRSVSSLRRCCAFMHMCV